MGKLTMLSPTASSPEPSIALLLVDEDMVWRSGLRICLSIALRPSHILEVSDGDTALRALAQSFAASALDLPEDGLEDAPEAARGDRPEVPPKIPPIWVVLIDLQLAKNRPDRLQSFNLCQQIKQTYPDVRVILVSQQSEPLLLDAARQAGADGYCSKQLTTDMWITVIRQVAAGETCWIPMFENPVNAGRLPLGETTRTTNEVPSLPTGEAGRSPTLEPSESVSVPSSSGLALLRHALYRSGIQQIDRALVSISTELQAEPLTVLDRLVLSGRQRELRTARWLVNRLLITANERQSGIAPTAQPAASAPVSRQQPNLDTVLSSSEGVPLMPVTLGDRLAASRDLRGVLFDTLLAKLQTPLQNQTDLTLEIDILREDRRRELLYIILRQIENVLEDLRHSHVEPEQLLEVKTSILIDIWESTLTEFFGKYYTLSMREKDVLVVEFLLRDRRFIAAELLDPIPLTTELWQHLLFQTPLMVDSVPYAAGNPAALKRAGQLLENTILAIANAVMQSLLNHFANVEDIKHHFYDRHLLSLREVERFRNNLSWRYRLQRYVIEPIDMFESQYRLLVLGDRGIQQTTIYATRDADLENLGGIRYAVTLALEARDAIAPRLRAAVSWLGSGLIYLLTDVVGRSLGLIGRGIVKGMGSAWQESRYSRSSDQNR
jgi:DNA-binding NarL/FixJ family response regulator